MVSVTFVALRISEIHFIMWALHFYLLWHLLWYVSTSACFSFYHPQLSILNWANHPKLLKKNQIDKASLLLAVWRNLWHVLVSGTNSMRPHMLHVCMDIRVNASHVLFIMVASSDIFFNRVVIDNHLSADISDVLLSFATLNFFVAFCRVGTFVPQLNVRKPDEALKILHHAIAMPGDILYTTKDGNQDFLGISGSGKLREMIDLM